MKSDRRHELQTNVLADWLGTRLEGVKPYITHIAIAVVAVVAVAAGSYWYVTSTDRETASSWSQYFGAFNQREPEQALARVMANQSGSEAALWAAQSVGDMNLAQGAMLMFSDRAEAEKRLDKAKEALEQVRAGASDPMLKTRALLSLGKLYETKLQPEEARRYYEQAADISKNTAIGKYAAAQERRMKDQRQVELLAWFAEQTPKRPAPLPGMGMGAPGLPNDLPTRPDLSIPGFGDFGFGTESTADPQLPQFPPPGAPPAGDDSLAPDAPAPELPPTDAPPPGTPATDEPQPPPPADPPTNPQPAVEPGDQQPE